LELITETYNESRKFNNKPVVNLTNNIFSDKLCILLNYPPNAQVEQIEERIRNNRRLGYVMVHVDDNLENDKLFGIIDFESYYSLF
jgi:hypothetical protein